MSIYRTINPATGEIEKTFESHTNNELFSLLEKAHQFWLTEWRQKSFKERKAIVQKAADILGENKEKYAELIAKEMGKPIAEAIAETTLSSQILAYYAQNAEAFLAPKKLDISKGLATVVKDPLGVIYCVEPWNYPYYQLARVAGPNLMAGNVVMIKHAPNVPQCALAFEELFHKAGAPKGAYTNLFISNDQSEQLIARPEVKGIALTGSERAGSQVASQAGRSLKKTTLELGGSDPFIVRKDADLKLALDLAVALRTSNMGQICTAAKRMIVHESLVDEFTTRLEERMKHFKYGNPLNKETTHGPMSSENALNLALEQVDRAVKGGANLKCGGKRIPGHGFFLEAGILTNVKKDNPIFYEEIFAPIAMIFPVKSDEEAIALANDTQYGLGGSIISKDVKQAREIAAEIQTGMVMINGMEGTAPYLPFGGTGRSGYGRELSEVGILEFVNHKLIYSPNL